MSMYPLGFDQIAAIRKAMNILWPRRNRYLYRTRERERNSNLSPHKELFSCRTLPFKDFSRASAAHIHPTLALTQKRWTSSIS